MATDRAQDSTPAKSSLPNPLDFLASTKKRILVAGDLKKGLGLSGKDLVVGVAKLISVGALKCLGYGHSIDPEGVITRGPARYVAVGQPQGGEFWVRLTKGFGTPVVIEGVGTVDAVGKLVELTGYQFSTLDSRECPVEVITDQESIAQLVKAAEELARKKAEVRDKHRGRLAELAAA
jgi:hypothetical protein